MPPYPPRQTLIHQTQRAIDRPGAIGRLRGGVQELRMINSRALVRVGNLRPQLQGKLKMTLGSRRRRQLSGRPPGADRRRKRTRKIVRGEPMPGEHRDGIQSGDPGLAAALDRLRILSMHARPLARQQIVMNGRARQGVTKAVAATRRVDHQQLMLDGLPQRSGKLHVRKADHGGKELLGHPGCSSPTGYYDRSKAAGC
jgi:hypothetical protein